MNTYEATISLAGWPAPTTSAQELQNPLACFPGALVLVTCGHGADGVGLLARSFAILSPASALVAWTIERHAAGALVLEQATQWEAHALAYDQAALAARLAAASGESLGDTPLWVAASGIRVLRGGAVTLSCQRVATFACEDSLIVIGRVAGFVRGDLPPLIRHDNVDTIGIDIAGRPLGVEAATTATSLSYLLGSAFFYLYGKMREVGGRLGYNNIEMFVLTALGERGGRTRREIETLLAYSAHPTNLQAMDDLEARGLIESRDASNGVLSDASYHLTSAGRAVFEQARQAGLRVEAEMGNLLGVPETVALRALLCRFVGKIDRYAPAAWL
ncbi:3-hydroxy-9,10-secoandrosta-1,3,5(10)-triene-9,17-dione monooxygenase reductase component [Duganella sp. SG902]|uniref:flavin reductase n=1 Tax=Duganella sp. SG902 TaxID=2587016 RepID=UPI00159D7CFF|nr:flavin reductase [Duganella sp. SG902]NVM77499.1 3-hydroxy-9,10-secoandrosta-1,3,5(10)-triene-9,17-dione monooxygenase reductase component [Duganella sp. SG902]